MPQVQSKAEGWGSWRSQRPLRALANSHEGAGDRGGCAREGLAEWWDLPTCPGPGVLHGGVGESGKGPRQARDRVSPGPCEDGQKTRKPGGSRPRSRALDPTSILMMPPPDSSFWCRRAHPPRLLERGSPAATPSWCSAAVPSTPQGRQLESVRPRWPRRVMWGWWPRAAAAPRGSVPSSPALTVGGVFFAKFGTSRSWRAAPGSGWAAGPLQTSPLWGPGRLWFHCSGRGHLGPAFGSELLLLLSDCGTLPPETLAPV